MADYERSAADIVAAAGVPDFVLEDDDIVVGVIVIADARDQTGVYFRSSTPPSLNWLDRIAMLQCAADVERATAPPMRQFEE